MDRQLLLRPLHLLLIICPEREIKSHVEKHTDFSWIWTSGIQKCAETIPPALHLLVKLTSKISKNQLHIASNMSISSFQKNTAHWGCVAAHWTFSRASETITANGKYDGDFSSCSSLWKTREQLTQAASRSFSFMKFGKPGTLSSLAVIHPKS